MTIILIYLFKLSYSRTALKDAVSTPTHLRGGLNIPFISNWLEKEHTKSILLEKHLVQKGFPSNKVRQYVFNEYLCGLKNKDIPNFFLKFISTAFHLQLTEKKEEIDQGQSYQSLT